MAAIGRLDDIVIDCPDMHALAAFWAELLGYRILSIEPSWITLAHPDDAARRMSLQQVEDYRRPHWPGQDHPQQIHLDVRVADLDAAHDSVLALGAGVLSDVQNPDSTPWRIYEDPAGHPFCLVTGPIAGAA
jgi:hypothetical protein